MARMLRLAGALGAVALCAGSNPHPDMGGYRPASNVVEHAQMIFDIRDITAAANEADWETAKEIYTNGRFSCKSPSQTRTLQGFVNQATYDGKLRGEAFMDTFAGGNGDRIPGTGRLALSGTFWDDMMLAALDGTGDFAQLSAVMRKTLVKKGILGILTLYSTHELESAITKARDGNFADGTGAPHAWDEGWAFYYGSYNSAQSDPRASDEGKFSAWEFAKKRDLDFAFDGNGEAVPGAVDSRTEILPYFRKGLRASRDDTAGDAVEEMYEARDDIYRLFALASIRAALKYAEKTQTQTETAKIEEYHMEAYAYFLAAAGWVEQAAPGVGANVLDLLDFRKTEAQLDRANLYCAVKAALIPSYEPLGLDCAMVGEWKDHDAALDASCSNVPACPNATALPEGLDAYTPDTDTSAGENMDCGVAFAAPETEISDAATRTAAAGAAGAWLLMAALLRAA